MNPIGNFILNLFSVNEGLLIGIVVLDNTNITICNFWYKNVKNKQSSYIRFLMGFSPIKKR